ncbi:RNA polymerase sigma factor [Altererythrobacter arenosus]|uniref:RNA polymerase sigma factor n=1 Tax=Altererythrobacter arenosus TaxID=3032592 RepID=A0ABY8G0X0_9SPHN|nr:RNA polymerase sigma factor [Altererythrobacter sp. CAU 1644]WFL77944.1 RNA polymerase sigma factor [Altererythrobacter sp. CAU 1644]
MTQKRPSLPGSGPLYDELLVLLVRNGDRAAAERLYKRWHPRLARTAWRYSGDAGLAEQLAQDCWVAVWQGIARLKDPAKFAPWVFGILQRKGADQIRLRQRERGTALEEVPSIAPRQEDALALREAFATLPPEQRLAAHLHFVEGLTLREIAEVQEVAEGTAKTRLFHARRKLKAALSDKIEGEEP